MAAKSTKLPAFLCPNARASLKTTSGRVASSEKQYGNIKSAAAASVFPSQPDRPAGACYKQF